MAIKFFTKHNTQKGFTLVEMIVVLAIVGVISAVTMFNYSDFRQGIDSRNLAEEMALSIRKAQSYATSSKGINDINGDRIKAFGIVFSTKATHTSTYAPYAKGFMLYAGVPVAFAGTTSPQYTFSNLGTANCDPNMFGIWTGTQCLEYFSITSPVSITKLETLDAYGTWSELPTTTALTQLQIIFFRPKPDAVICITQGMVGDCEGKSAGRITITSQNGKIQKTITVWNTGQIAVENVVQNTGGGSTLNCYPNDPRIECATEIGGGGTKGGFGGN